MLTNTGRGDIIKSIQRRSKKFLTRKGIIKNTLIWKFKKRRLNPLDTAAEFKIQYVSGMANINSRRISLNNREETGR